MLGLRGQETSKFLKFWKMIQDLANKSDKTFFLDCGEGNEFEDDNIECENLSGWLVPNSQVKEFDKLFQADKIDKKWEDCVAFVKWEFVGSEIKITFE